LTADCRGGFVHACTWLRPTPEWRQRTGSRGLTARDFPVVYCWRWFL